VDGWVKALLDEFGDSPEQRWAADDGTPIAHNWVPAGEEFERTLEWAPQILEVLGLARWPQTHETMREFCETALPSDPDGLCRALLKLNSTCQRDAMSCFACPMGRHCPTYESLEGYPL